MRTLLLTGAAALSLASLSTFAVAQDGSAPPGSTNTVDDKRGDFTLSTEQQATYDAWPPERQTVYTAWVPAYQQYYWTLQPTQQDAYWLLSDEQRGQINAMTAAQRTLAWQSIERQLASAQTANEANAAVAPVTATSVTSRTTGAGEQEIVSTTTGNLAPPPADSLGKDYPLCSATVHDSCQNRGEGGAPGRSRALDHWPGAPASELDASAKASTGN